MDATKPPPRSQNDSFSLRWPQVVRNQEVPDFLSDEPLEMTTNRPKTFRLQSGCRSQKSCKPHSFGRPRAFLKHVYCAFLKHVYWSMCTLFVPVPDRSRYPGTRVFVRLKSPSEVSC
eukprot:3921098-Rhodomonas_salina.1